MVDMVLPQPDDVVDDQQEAAAGGRSQKSRSGFGFPGCGGIGPAPGAAMPGGSAGARNMGADGPSAAIVGTPTPSVQDEACADVAAVSSNR